jgi:hypothetical protein
MRLASKPFRQHSPVPNSAIRVMNLCTPEQITKARLASPAE